ncbi:MAG: tyrosine-type recombinase/integrase [Chthoniobacter sp.]
MLRRRLELEVALLAPRLQAADLPSGIREIVRDAGGEKAQVKAIEPAPSIVRAQAPAPGSGEKPRAAIEAALRAYLDFIRIENARHHVAGKLSMMRRFFGSRRVEIVTETPARAGKNSAAVHSPYFMGGFVDEITSVGVQSFMNQLGVSKKTKRHYREFFHHFFEFCMKFEFYRPTNWHSPNPIAALPSYVSRNRVIVFLTQEQVEQQLRLLADHPRLHMAVALMIYAGLRRAEMLWLSRDAISKDLSYLSIVNRIDNDRDIESSLKTGDRTVTILPPLKALLENYLPGLRGNWVIPSSKGKQWGGDSFSDKLRSLNKAAGLKWNCLHYRHTFATQRAFVGWPLFRIAKEMGNSVSVVEEYYAGFIRPIDNPSPAYKEPSPELLSASVSSSESSPASD